MATIIKYKTQTGKQRYRVRWRDNGLQKSKSFDRSKAATEFKIKLEHDLRQGSYIAPIKITVDEYLEQWLDIHSKSITYNTIQDYTHNIKHIKRHIGGVYLQKLHAGNIEIMYKRLSATLSGKYIRNIHSMLNTALKAAVRNKLIHSNPCDLLSPPKVKNKFEAAFIAPEDISKYINIFKNHWLYPAVVISLMCGLRRGEILGLKWKDINFTDRTMNVERSAYLNTDDKTLYDKRPKNGKSRTVYIPEQLCEILKEVKKEQRRSSIELGELYERNDYVLVLGDGHRPRLATISRAFSTKLSQSELQHVRFHDLRHTAGSLMLLEGQDIKTVSEVLGHSSISITADIYLHVLNSMKKKAADSVGKYLNSI